MMKNKRRAHALGVFAVSGIALALAPHDALAQPNPFDAYEGKRQADKTSEVAPGAQQVAVARECDCDEARAGVYDQTSQGQLVVDLRTTLATTFSSNETAEDGVVRNSTLFARLTPGVGYFLFEDVEVGGSAGMMWRRIARDTQASSTSRDFLFEARARYHYHLTERFTLIPGLTLGGYLGTSTRATPLVGPDSADTVDERTRTYGGAMTLNLDSGYAISEKIAINAGVGVIGLLGGERVQALDERFRVTTVNASVNLGVVYAF